MPKITSTKMPQEALLVVRYDDLDRYVRAWARGQVNILIIVVPHGRGKSTAVADALRAEGVAHGVLTGRATPFRFFCECYALRDHLIVLDDADPILASRDGLALAKALTDTRAAKAMRWNSRATGEEVPAEYDTSSRVCILANSWAEGYADWDAIADRGTLLYFSPTPTEIVQRAEPWADPLVVAAVRRQVPYMEDLSLRLFKTAAEQLAIGGPEMMTAYLRTKLASGAKGHAIALLLDDRFGSNNERAREFRRVTGMSERTFYRMAESLCRDLGEVLGGGQEHAGGNDRPAGGRSAPAPRALPAGRDAPEQATAPADVSVVPVPGRPGDGGQGITKSGVEHQACV